MMGISFSGLKRNRGFAVAELEPRHSAGLPELHREDFVRPWSEEEFSSMLGDSHVFGFAAIPVGAPGAAPVGFVLARLAAGEAEILTITVARRNRGAGLGWKLMDAVLRRLHAERAESLFLEVDETNAPALALYRHFGFEQVGRRPNYYEGSGTRGRTSALVMRLDLR